MPAGIALDPCRRAGLATPKPGERSFKIEPVINLAAADTGLIEGKVTDEVGKPLDGAVISALGGTTAFAVSDKGGQLLAQAASARTVPGPRAPARFSRRAQRDGQRPAVDAQRFLLQAAQRGLGDRAAYHRGVGRRDWRRAGDPRREGGDRDESELGWRLRHLKRGVLRDAQTLAGIPADDDWFITDSFEFLGRAFGTSARAATALFSDLSLGGQVNLLTTGAFDNPLQLLQLDRTSSVAFFKVGAPVGHARRLERPRRDEPERPQLLDARRQLRRHGRRAASLPVRHVVQPAALRGRQHRRARRGGPTPRATSARCSPTTSGQVSRYVSLGYGANYARYDYMEGSALFSPRLSVTLSPS